MKARKYFILGVVCLILTAGLILRANSPDDTRVKKAFTEMAEDVHKLQDEAVRSTTEFIKQFNVDRQSFLGGLTFAKRQIALIEGQMAIDASLKGSLAGLEGVSVGVEYLPALAEKYGLTRQLLQTDTELRLRQHGIKVGANQYPQDNKLSPESLHDTKQELIYQHYQQAMDAKTDEDFVKSTIDYLRLSHSILYDQLGHLHPCLYININSSINEERHYAAFSIKVELHESARLNKNNAQCKAVVWEEGMIGTCSLSDLKEYARECLRDRVDQFINEYLAANPKDRPIEKNNESRND